MNDNKCILPWIHLEASATGHAKPCCLYKEPVIVDNKPAKLDNMSLEEIWNSSYIEDLRQQFLDGKKPQGCEACWQQEKVGKISKRQESNEKYNHRQNRWYEDLQSPTYLDLKLGTVCNLKCRSCSTHSSYKWKDDEFALHGETFNKDLHSYWIEEDSTTWKEIENLIPYLEYLDFTQLTSILERERIWFSNIQQFEDPYEGTIPRKNIEEEIEKIKNLLVNEDMNW